MKNYLILLCITLLASCGSTQKATSHLQSGHYDEAFATAAAELKKDKSKKSNEKLISVLKEAYEKAGEQDLATIKALEKQSTIENLKKIYGTYLNLDIRQDEVQSLQPLFLEGKEVTFETRDYSKLIPAAKKKYADLLYTTAQHELKGGVMEARSAYQHLQDLLYIDATYKNNLSELSQKAKDKGSSFVFVSLNNKVSDISKDSLQDLQQINAANFSNPWVIFHDKKQRGISYAYEVAIILDKLTFEPEKTLQEQVPQEAVVQDGWKYKLDTNGNVMKDDKGNDIKEPKYITVKAEVLLYQQNKASRLDGTITIKDLHKNTQDTKEEFGEAKFQHLYGKYRGDQRAIDQKYYEALQSKAVPYPQDYEFVKYSLLQFKQKLTAFVSEQSF